MCYPLDLLRFFSPSFSLLFVFFKVTFAFTSVGTMAAEAKQVDPTEYRVPRNFKLLDELESAEKGKYSDAKKYGEDAIYITVGLNGQDPTFTNWNGSIIPHQVEWTCFFL